MKRKKKDIWKNAAIVAAKLILAMKGMSNEEREKVINMVYDKYSKIENLDVDLKP
jgi:hypothetical protein